MTRTIPSNWNQTKRQKQKITPPQITALQACWTRLRAANDVRVHLGAQEGPDRTDRELRLLWAFWKLGRRITSFVDMTPAEAAYCLDICNGASTRLDTAIDAELKRAAIVNPADWFRSIRPVDRVNRNFWTFGGRDFNELNFIDKMHLLNILKTRNPAFFRR